MKALITKNTTKTIQTIRYLRNMVVSQQRTTIRAMHHVIK